MSCCNNILTAIHHIENRNIEKKKKKKKERHANIIHVSLNLLNNNILYIIILYVTRTNEYIVNNNISCNNHNIRVQ